MLNEKDIKVEKPIEINVEKSVEKPIEKSMNQRKRTEKKPVAVSVIKPELTVIADEINQKKKFFDKSNYIPISDKRKVIFITKISETYTAIFQKSLKGRTEHIGFRGKLYPINLNYPAYRLKNMFLYFIDIQEGQVQFESAGNQIPTQLLDAVIEQQLGKQLVSGLESSPVLSSFLMLLFTTGFGFVFGLLIAIVFHLG